jgi:hypothetical protein
MVEIGKKFVSDGDRTGENVVERREAARSLSNLASGLCNH